jgi:carbon storage regulator CsrA
MLVLSRRVGEAIVIGGQVLVTIRSVRSRSVSLGIMAPEEVPVDRSEIHLRRHAESGSPGGGDPPARADGKIGADLLTAIRRLVADVQAGGGPEIEFCHDFQDYAANPLPPCLELAVFRIVQECVSNASCYSKSKQVLIGLSRDDDSLCIEAQDWGIGFDAATIGTKRLEAIWRRSDLLGGTVSIQSRPGEGTCITVQLPLVAPSNKQPVKRGATARRG